MNDTGEGTFASRPLWQRMLVIAAGPGFNFILAWILSVILISCIGYDEPYVLSVADRLPAFEAGIQEGDKILSLDNRRVFFFREISDYVQFNQQRMSKGPVRIVWEHDGEKKEAYLQPAADESGRYIFGITGSEYIRTKATVKGALCYGAAEVRYWIRLTFLSLRMLVKGQVSANEVSGPVGVVSAISNTYEESRRDGIYYVFLNMINIAILLSANLGVMNLLPIPALDGGRLFFLLIELVRHKKMDQRIEGRIHLIGIMLLLLLMFVIMANDIRKLF